MIARGKELLNQIGDFNSLAWSPDGSRVAAGSNDTTTKIWEIRTGRQLLTLGVPNKALNRRGILSVAWSPDGERLAIGKDDGTIEIWDANSGKEVLVLHGSDYVYSVAWSPDGNHLAAGMDDNTAKVWDVVSPQQSLTLGIRKEKGSPYNYSVRSVAWSPDGKRVATGSSEGKVEVWGSSNGKEELTFDCHHLVNSVAWSPDGHRLAAGIGDNTTSVWDLASRQQLLTLGIGQQDSSFSKFAGDVGIMSVAWSPDGKRIATASGKFSFPGTVKLWDAHNGRELLALGHVIQALAGFGIRGESINSVAWSPDGGMLASAGVYTLQIYTCDLRELMELARHDAKRQPAAEKCRQYLGSETCPALTKLPWW